MSKRAVAILMLALISALFARSLLAQEEAANIRLAHFSADTPAISLLVNSEETNIQEIAFGTVTEWFSLPAGTYTLALTTTTQSTDVRFDIEPLEIELTEESWSTFALIGSPERSSLTLHAISEDYSELSRGEARLSVFHAIEGAPALDITRNGDVLFQFLNYPGVIADDDGEENDGFVVQDVIANVYEIEFVENDDPDEVVVDIDRIRLTDSNNHFLAAIGTQENPLFALVRTDIAEITRTERPDLLSVDTDESEQLVRLAHFSSGTPSVDIYVDDVLTYPRLDFAEVTDYIQLPSGAETITIVPSGLTLDDALLPPTDISFTTERWLTAALIGTLDNNSLTLQVLEEDLSTLDENTARLGIFQAIPGIRPVNVRLGDGTVLIRLLGYPGSQGNNDGLESVDLVAGDYTVEVVSAVGTNVLARLTDQRFQGGRSYLLVTLRATPPLVFVSTEIVPEEE